MPSPAGRQVQTFCCKNLSCFFLEPLVAHEGALPVSPGSS